MPFYFSYKLPHCTGQRFIPSPPLFTYSFSTKQEAIKRQEEQDRDAAAGGDRKRGYNSFKANDSQATAEDMEAYRLKRARIEDPLAAMEAGAAKGAGVTGGYDLV